MLKRIVALLFFVQVSFGQTKAGLELCIQYQNSFSAFTTEKEANEALDKILNVIGASKNFTLVPCDDISNALAVTFKGERFILFDGEFMRKITQLTNNWANLFILAHEVGHHINGHTRDFLLATVLDDQSLADRRKEELEADEFASFIVSRLGASYAQIEETIDLIASNESDQYSTHPSYDKRIAAVKKGFDRAYSSSGTSKSNSSNRNKSSVVISSSASNDLMPNFENPRNSKNYEFGSWTKSTVYRLESWVRDFKAKDDPFKLEELKQSTAVKDVVSKSYGKSLSPLGSKHLSIEIITGHYTYNYVLGGGGKKYEIFKTPNKFYEINLNGFYETPKEIMLNTSTFNPDNVVYITFDYIIDGKLSGSLVGVFGGWYNSNYLYTKEGTIYLEDSQLAPYTIKLNSYLTAYNQKENYEFIERLKSGNKLYLRLGKIFQWNGYLNGKDGAWDTSKTNNNYDVPRYTYEFDLTGSSKALSF